MKNNLIKIKEKALSKFKLKNNYLFNENGYYYFSPTMGHCLFMVDDQYNANGEGSLFLNYEEYLFNFFEVCKETKNEASFVFYKSFTTYDNVAYHLGDKHEHILEAEEVASLNKKPCLYFIGKEDNFGEIFKLLANDRNDCVNNDLFIVLNNPEEELIENLSTYITISQSRRIYFIVFIQDKNLFIENYSPEELEIVESLCRTKFICSKKEILFVVPHIAGKSSDAKYEYKSTKLL